MLKLFSAAGSIFSLAVLLGGCGSGTWDAAARSSEALSTLTPDSPAQGQVVTSSTVTFSGRSSTVSGSTVSVAAKDGRLVVRTCSPKVGRDQTPSPTRDSSPVLTGTSSATSDDEGDDHDDDDDEVVSLAVSENGKVHCSVANVSSRQWSCKVSSTLADGSHLLVATVKRGDSVSPPSNPDLFVVKTSIAAPTLDQVPTPSNLNRPVFSGHGEPAAVVSVTESGTPLCDATVSAGGAWTCTSPALPDGSHTASASQEDTAGNVSSSVSVTFVLDTHLPGAPTLDAPASPTANPQVTFTGTGEAGDQAFVADAILGILCSGRVDSTGKWSCSPANPLDDGDYVLTAFQVTPVGNRSGPSAPPRTLSVRTLSAPMFDPPQSPTRDNKPLFSGTLSATASGGLKFAFAAAATSLSVAVVNGETPLCSGTVDGTGHWSCSPSQALPDGSYLLVALLTDGKGHFSGPSMARSLV